MAYLGNQPIIGDSINKFKILDDISTFTLTFDGSSANTVSVANDTIIAPNHRFITGQKVTYSDGGGTVITGLTDGTSYFIIKVDQNTIQLATSSSNASSATAIDLTGLGAGASHTLNVKFDGTNTKFKITHNNGTKSTITKPEQLSLSINGVIQNPASDYSVESDSTLVFNSAPVSTDKAFGSFIEAVVTFEASDFDEHTIDEFIGDGSTTAFSLSKTPPSSRDIIVVIDGVFQYPHSSGQTRSYSASGSQLTFIAAPADGAVVQARHIGFAAATSTPGVTAFYGRTGNVTFDSSDDLSIHNLTASGNVSIDGVLTYEDVTNVDSIGIITARDGISITGGNVTLTGGGSFIGDGSTLTGVASTENVNTSSLNVVGIATVGSGITLSPDGDGFFTGITTTRSASFGGGVLQETFHNDTSAVSGTHDHDALTYGMVWNGSTNAGGSFVINLRGDASTTFDSLIDIGKVTTMTIYSANNNTSNYMTAFQIDGSAQTIKYSGGSAPSAATGSGVDVYSLTIMKTAASTFSVFGNFTNFA
tara:strand:+ start:1022 stop:2626 length:1605 start_codon:yes stop_codon:yes gene_type:complete